MLFGDITPVNIAADGGVMPRPGQPIALGTHPLKQLVMKALLHLGQIGVLGAVDALIWIGI